MGPALLLPDLKSKLRAMGYEGIVTYGGPIPLDEWNPYGMEPGGVNYSPDYHAKHAYRGAIRDDGKIEDMPDGSPVPSGPFMAGVWTPILSVAHKHSDNLNRCLSENASGEEVCCYGTTNKA